MTGIVDLLRELRDPDCYPDAPARVEIVQTHISVVALTDARAYKFKKTLRLPFLDTSTRARREHFCREELRLNRRLCPDVYLEVLALVRTGSGLRLLPAPHDDAVDFAVAMRRLPTGRMLDQLLQHGTVAPTEIEALARRVAAFHADAERSAAITAHGSPEKLRELALANFAELSAQPDHGLSRPLLAALERSTHADFAAVLPLLQRRAAAGRIVDGHGDLHSRNICMTSPPAIYDCIEFEPAFRCGDVATEVAFLVMDLRYREALPLAQAFVRSYAAAAGDDQLPALLPALVRYRALVRAKVAAITSREAEQSADDRAGAHGSAVRHLQLAAITAVEQQPLQWWIVCGPPASGKTALCTALAAASGWQHLNTDVVRKQQAGVAPTARLDSAHYTAAASDRTYAELLRLAAASPSPVVLLDGNFATPARRAAAFAAARARGASPLCVHVHIDAAEALRRLQRRAAEGEGVSDAGPEQFAALQARFQPPQPGEGRVVTLDGAEPLPAMLDAVLLAALA